MSEHLAYLESLPDQPPSSEPQGHDQTSHADPKADTHAVVDEPAPEVEFEPQAMADTPQAGMDELFSEQYTYQRPKRGQIRHGRIMSISSDRIIVDLGLKREGVVPEDDLAQVGADAIAQLAVGEEIPVTIIRTEDDKEGAILVSWSRARQEQDWFDVERLRDNGEIWEGKVRGHNRGGLIVHYGKIRGFIPASHITGISRRLDAETLQTKLGEMDNQVLPLKVIEVDRQNRRLIFSERVARREWRVQRRERLLDELKEGEIVQGVVSNICDFGAFVDVGGTDGLVHISELSWRRTAHPGEVVKVGDEVDVYVLRVDRDRKRIGLSMRLAEPDPWETVDSKYEVGQMLTVTITKLIDFGAFATLEDGIEGLIHISELAEVSPKQTSDVVAIGMVVPARIIKIDSPRRRMGLSLRHVTDEERELWEKERADRIAESADETLSTEPDEPEEYEAISEAEGLTEESLSIQPDESEQGQAAAQAKEPAEESLSTQPDESEAGQAVTQAEELTKERGATEPDSSAADQAGDVSDEAASEEDYPMPGANEQLPSEDEEISSASE